MSDIIPRHCTYGDIWSFFWWWDYQLLGGNGVAQGLFFLLLIIRVLAVPAN